MLRFLRLLLALCLAQVLLFVLFLVTLSLAVGARRVGPQVRAHSGLWVRLEGDLIEYPTLPSVPILQEIPISQAAILDCLQRAAADRRIDVVFIDLGTGAAGWGKAAELRRAVLRFRASGKQVWTYSSVVDEVGLYLASACDSIYMAPHGRLVLNGMALGGQYYKGALDKLGVRPNLHRIGAYKDAAEPLLRTGMSDEARQQAGWLLDDLWGEFQSGIAEQRHLAPEVLATAIAAGMLQPEEARARGLIDGVCQRQDLVARFGRDGGKPRLVPVEAYRKLPPRAVAGARTIAVVHTRGLILAGKNSYHPLLGTILGGNSAVRDLETAAADPSVAAIVLRIDSPGGDIIPSDAIGHAVERAKQTKPVVVSMVDVAASGGYMIAYRASRLVALPTTITGSIGMISGKLNVHDLYAKLGITRDFVTRGAYPFLYSDFHDWTAPEESLVVRGGRQDYRRWIADIAARRGVAVEDIARVGEGRVWTGRQALERHLVDELGDQERAVEVAKELAGVSAGTPARLVHYPQEMGLMEMLLERETAFAALLERSVRAVELPQAAAWAVLDLRLGR